MWLADSVIGLDLTSECRHPTAGRRLRVEHCGEVLRMGEVAGANAAGVDNT